MSDYRDLLERVGDRVPMPEPAFERIVARRQRKRRNQRIGAGVLGVVVAVALIAALTQASPGPRTQPETSPGLRANGAIAYTAGGIFLGREGASPVQIVDMTDGDGFPICPAFSPEGDRIAYVLGAGEDTSDLVVADIGTDGIVPGSAIHIAMSSTTCPQWSPDGRTLLFVNPAGSVLTIPASGGEPRVLRLGGAGSYAWSPDSSMVAAALGGSILILRVEDNGVVATIDRDADRGFLAWSPDGSKIASGPQVFDVASGALALQAPLRSNLAQPHWSPDGSSIAYVQNDGILIVETADGSWFEIPRPDVPGTRIDEVQPLGAFEWSPDGTRFATAAGCVITTASIDGSSPPMLISPEDADPWSCGNPAHIDWQAVPQ